MVIPVKEEGEITIIEVADEVQQNRGLEVEAPNEVNGDEEVA